MQQRVVIAMALACDPKLLVLDEPTTGLDATVEAEVLDLVSALRQDHGAAVLFISHNLGVIRKMCDDVAVLYAGRTAETGPTEEVFAEPSHPYTMGLLRCIPRAGATKARGGLDTIPGFLPDRPSGTTGCVFADRCGLATDVCLTEAPPPVAVAPGRISWCHHHDETATLPRVEGTDTPLVPAAASHDKPVLLTLKNTSKTFTQDGADIRALRDVNLHIHAGETLGLVGESGSGKTTLAKVIIGMHAPDVGSSVTLTTEPLGPVAHKRTRDQIRSIQIVFQNPDSALNPKFAVKRIIGRALTKLEGRRGQSAHGRTVELTRAVQLADHYLDAKPAQLSGGLKQRVAIARAFAGPPRLVVCDEPTSALDVSVQAAILNLLVELQERTDVAYLFISHDLGVVRYISDRIAVLYLGEVVEIGDAAQVFDGPHHPYTEALLSAVASVDGTERDRIRLEGEIPSATDVPSGCPFHTRCPRKIGEICETSRPELTERSPRHLVRCHLPDDELGRVDGSVPVPVTITSRV
jgi:peptide/nickel transport system ATP-binding protein